MRKAVLAVIVSLAGCLVACGQKGPLLLPDAQHPHKKIGLPKPSASPAPGPAGPTATAPAVPGSDASPAPLPAAPDPSQP